MFVFTGEAQSENGVLFREVSRAEDTQGTAVTAIVYKGASMNQFIPLNF